VVLNCDSPPGAQEDRHDLRDREGYCAAEIFFGEGKGGDPGRCVTAVITNLVGLSLP
jgi:hypothetical protein